MYEDFDPRDANVSATDPDWSREEIRRFWDPGPKLIRSIRRYQALKAKGARLRSKYWVMVHWFWSLVTQSEIHLSTQIGGGFRLPHPTGIIIHHKSVIGPNVMIFHQVTLAQPCTIGGHVDIGAGAKLMGPLTVGDHVTIGANAVVTGDVADGLTVAGIPAREITRTGQDALPR